MPRRSSVVVANEIRQHSLTKRACGGGVRRTVAAWCGTEARGCRAAAAFGFGVVVQRSKKERVAGVLLKGPLRVASGFDTPTARYPLSLARLFSFPAPMQISIIACCTPLSVARVAMDAHS